MTADELIKRRKTLGLTQAQLAIAIDRPVDTVQNWEQGRRQIEMGGVLRFLLARLEDDKAAYGDQGRFVASLPTFLTRDRP